MGATKGRGKIQGDCNGCKPLFPLVSEQVRYLLEKLMNELGFHVDSRSTAKKIRRHLPSDFAQVEWMKINK